MTSLRLNLSHQLENAAQRFTDIKNETQNHLPDRVDIQTFVSRHLNHVAIQMEQAVQWGTQTKNIIEVKAGQIKTDVAVKGNALKKNVIYIYKTITETPEVARQKCIEIAIKVKDFLWRHKKTILFVGLSVLTAAFAPEIFFPVAIATIIVRVVATYALKHLADYYMKDERNPYKIKPLFGPDYVSPLDITLGVIAALDAVALGTIFTTSAKFVPLHIILPIAGGIVAGNFIAKVGMDIANSWV